MEIYDNFTKSLKYLKGKLKSDDVNFLPVKTKKVTGYLIFIKDLTDKKAIGELVLRPITEMDYNPKVKSIKDAFLSPEKKEITDLNDLINEVVTGNACLIVKSEKVALSFGLKKFEKRAITEPPTSTVIKGPREGFVESLPVNVSLLRRRIKSPDLKIESLSVGKYSRTDVSLCYIDSVADKDLVKKIRTKLEKIDIDAVLDSSYIAKMLGEHKTSFFKQLGNTEKPDILTAKILEGRVAIMVDGSPIVLTVPYVLAEDFQSPSDYYTSPYTATLSRIIRLLSVIISVFLPAYFVSAELFHLQLIPLSFLLTIVNSIKGIPLSPSLEMFFTLLIFEILNEASVRMPKYVGMVVSIVGGLVLGETAVTAGIISAPTLMIIALSGICLYTVPELEQIFSIIRLIFLTIAGSVGGFGLIAATVIFIIYLVSFENYDTPLMAPFSPLIARDLKDGLYKGFLTENKFRPLSINQHNKRRLKTLPMNKQKKEN